MHITYCIYRIYIVYYNLNSKVALCTVYTIANYLLNTILTLYIALNGPPEGRYRNNGILTSRQRTRLEFYGTILLTIVL